MLCALCTYRLVRKLHIHILYISVDDCSAASFRCISNIEAMTGPYCIHYSLVCDGTEQCLRGDDEDELACSTTCSTESFRCDNGDCVPGHYRCDYVNDCDDRSDENDCGMFDLVARKPQKLILMVQ